MLDFSLKNLIPRHHADEQSAIIEAIGRSQAMIQFDMNGNIISANDNFLKTLGFNLVEIINKHHSMFVDPSEVKGKAYKDFWADLRRGEFKSAQYMRIGKGGKEVWIQASYNPIMDGNGKPIKVIKFATDITDQKNQNANFRGQIEALGKSQATIEFNLDGTIITANDNFLKTLGYKLSEIEGKHHSIFVDPAERDAPEYAAFWKDLASGTYRADEFKRIAKDGSEVWIQASYNPIAGANGELMKVVKFATDITAQKKHNADIQGQIDAINGSQAVIHFEMDGTITDANPLFCGALGYELEEIVGKHHRIFVEEDYLNSAEYKKFWSELGKGKFQTGEFKRIGKSGDEVWIQATYTPIFDPNGNPFKVVKFATDRTAQVARRLEIDQIAVNLTQSLGDITGSVRSVEQQANSAATASEQTSHTVQTVASATEEFTASVTEVAQSMAASKDAVVEAVKELEAANTETTELSTAATSMNDIVEIIDQIANQINLLSLNATIEAARAGDAGKGFAVVASEVKSLASQVGSATETITGQISNIQGVADGMVTRLQGINKMFDEVHGAIANIAGAVEEQSATTSEISSSVQSAATAVAEIDGNLQEIVGAVQTSTSLANDGVALCDRLREG